MRAKNLFKAMVMALTASLIFVGCGKENSSGGSSSSKKTTIIGTGNGTIGLPSNYISVVGKEYPCNTGESGSRSRQRVQIAGQLNVNANARYLGVSIYGDILEIRRDGNKTSVDFHMCRRTGFARAEMYVQPALAPSDNCAIGQIDAANLLLYNNYGQGADVAFFPINYSAPSRLCQ